MLIRAVFTPLSPFRFFPESFTLFGAICWGIRVLYGESELEQMLSEFTKNPSFIISSPLPISKGGILFPKPILKGGWKDVASMEEYKERKNAKKLNYVDEKTLRKVLEGEIRTEKSLWDHVKDEHLNQLQIMGVAQPHASINRITWTTEGGQLYNEESTYIGVKFAVLIKFFDENYEEKVKASLSFTQIGGNKSTGMGNCRVEFEKYNGWIDEYINEQRGNFITLSPTLYDSSFLLEKSYYEVYPFVSPVDNYYGVISPAIWKRKTLFISKGSLITTESSKPFFGGIKKALFNRETNKAIYHYGYAFPLFTRWSYEN